MAYTIQHQKETKALADRGVHIMYQTSNRGRHEWYAVKSLDQNRELFRNSNRDSCVRWAMDLPVRDPKVKYKQDIANEIVALTIKIASDQKKLAQLQEDHWNALGDPIR
jgi:hypothetical protein